MPKCDVQCSRRTLVVNDRAELAFSTTRWSRRYSQMSTFHVASLSPYRGARPSPRPFASVADGSPSMMDRGADRRSDDQVWFPGGFAVRNGGRVASLVKAPTVRASNTSSPATMTMPPVKGCDGSENVRRTAKVSCRWRMPSSCAAIPFRTWRMWARFGHLHRHHHRRLKPLPRQFDVGVKVSISGLSSSRKYSAA